MQLPQVSVYHEQLADCYYFGPDCRRDKPRPSEVEATTLKRDATYASQLQPVREAAASEGGFSFSKELSIYFQADKLPLAELEAFTHCFLIRSPEAVVRSFLRAAANGGETTYFDADEVGFAELEQIFEAVTTGLGQAPIVIDANDLLAAPAAVLRAWCAAVGLPFDEGMTSWEPAQPKAWDKWAGWHDDAAASSGFRPPRLESEKQPEAPLPEEAEAVVAACQPIYDKLYAKRMHGI